MDGALRQQRIEKLASLGKKEASLNVVERLFLKDLRFSTAWGRPNAVDPDAPTPARIDDNETLSSWTIGFSDKAVLDHLGQFFGEDYKRFKGHGNGVVGTIVKNIKLDAQYGRGKDIQGRRGPDGYDRGPRYREAACS